MDFSQRFWYIALFWSFVKWSYRLREEYMFLFQALSTKMILNWNKIYRANVADPLPCSARTG